jgi:hypothetical protein
VARDSVAGGLEKHIMSIVERISTLMRANINDLIDQAEDPDTVIKQLSTIWACTRLSKSANAIRIVSVWDAATTRITVFRQRDEYWLGQLVPGDVLANGHLPGSEALRMVEADSVGP